MFITNVFVLCIKSAVLFSHSTMNVVPGRRFSHVNICHNRYKDIIIISHK